jgi:hypothetical protein
VKDDATQAFDTDVAVWLIVPKQNPLRGVSSSHTQRTARRHVGSDLLYGHSTFKFRSPRL